MIDLNPMPISFRLREIDRQVAAHRLKQRQTRRAIDPCTRSLFGTVGRTLTAVAVIALVGVAFG